MSELEWQPWSELDNDRKKDLLLHWWNYYGETYYTIEDRIIFQQELNENIDKIHDIAVMSYIYGYSTKFLVGAIRNKTVEDLKKKTKTKDDMAKEVREEYEKVEKRFDQMITESFRRPKSVVLFDEQGINGQVRRLLLTKNNKNE